MNNCGNNIKTKNNCCNIVLYQPEIAMNVGNIARTCAAFNITLHLIRPYNFIYNEKKMRRAGLDYWPYVKIIQYNNWNEFKRKNLKKNNFQIALLTRYGKHNFDKWKIDKKNKNTYFIFGKESTGIPKKILNYWNEYTFRIPMSKNVRSLNVSNCAAIAAYEFSKNVNWIDLKIKEPHKIEKQIK